MCRPWRLASPQQGHTDSAFVGRAAYLREQCSHHGVHILAVQESRSRHTETVQSASHIRLCSGRDQMGHHGVELWFDKQLPLSEDGAGSIRIQFADLLVLFADPRVLIVRFSRRGLQLLFVAVHAPCRQGAMVDRASGQGC